MKALKIVSLVILCILLFMSLSVFGPAFTVNNTILNPHFISAELDKLDISALVDETLPQSFNSRIKPDVRSSIVDTLDELEPEIKVQLKETIYQVYEYLLGRDQSLELTRVLKDTVLRSEFINSLTDKAGVTDLIREQIKDELAELIPPEDQELVRYLDDALPDIDPWLTEQMDTASGPIADYLLGSSTTLDIAISLEPMKNTLKTSIHDAFFLSPPLELVDSSEAEMESIFNKYYQEFSTQVPTTIVIDEESLGFDSNDTLAGVIADIEDTLADAKTAIGYFRMYFVILIIFICALILGIIFIHREVKGVTRDLGIVFLAYGGLGYIILLIGKYLIMNALTVVGMPSALHSWMLIVIRDFFRPLEILDLVLGIVGITLLVIAIVYRRRSTQVVDISTDK